MLCINGGGSTRKPNSSVQDSVLNGNQNDGGSTTVLLALFYLLYGTSNIKIKCFDKIVLPPLR